MHVDKEQLQRLADAEVAEPAEEWAREHMLHCESCRDRVSRAKSEQAEVFALLGNLDHPPRHADHATVIARARARDSMWMRKAAGFVVAAALAGAAYAAPGSPLPSLVEKVFGGGQDSPDVPAAQTTVPETPIVSGVTVATGNRMVIDFTASQAIGDIRVTLSDSPEMELRATGTRASFTAGEEILTVHNANSRARFAIAIPRRARLVEIRIGKNRVFLKDGARVVTDHAASGAETWIIPLASKR